MKSPYEILKAWREAHPEEVKLQRRRYQIRNWDRIREYQRKWQLKKRNDSKETTIQQEGVGVGDTGISEG